MQSVRFARVFHTENMDDISRTFDNARRHALEALERRASKAVDLLIGSVGMCPIGPEKESLAAELLRQDASFTPFKQRIAIELSPVFSEKESQWLLRRLELQCLTQAKEGLAQGDQVEMTIEFLKSAVPDRERQSVALDAILDATCSAIEDVALYEGTAKALGIVEHYAHSDIVRKLFRQVLDVHVLNDALEQCKQDQHAVARDMVVRSASNIEARDRMHTAIDQAVCKTIEAARAQGNTLYADALLAHVRDASLANTLLLPCDIAFAQTHSGAQRNRAASTPAPSIADNPLAALRFALLVEAAQGTKFAATFSELPKLVQAIDQATLATSTRAPWASVRQLAQQAGVQPDDLQALTEAVSYFREEIPDIELSGPRVSPMFR